MPQLPPEVKWAAALGRDYTHGNDVRALIDGPDAFQAIHEAIETTKRNSHFIYLLAWWLEVDLPLLEGKKETTLRVLFERKAKAGVQFAPWYGVTWVKEKGRTIHLGRSNRLSMRGKTSMTILRSSHQIRRLFRGEAR